MTDWNVEKEYIRYSRSQDANIDWDEPFSIDSLDTFEGLKKALEELPFFEDDKLTTKPNDYGD